jgi:hypothetical protein
VRKTGIALLSFAALLGISVALAPSPMTAQGRGGRGAGGTAAPTPIRRLPDGKPDFTGLYSAQSGGANYGLEQHPSDGLIPGTQGVVVDPPDKKLPYQPWARAESMERELPHRGYDDPTAHCFVAGVPRSMYTPSPYQILQPPGYVVLLFERMSWRQIPIDENRKHLPDNVRLWQGDSIGHWEGDTLVVDTTNLNGKTWMNERGDVLTYKAHIVEKFTPVSGTTITYEAKVDDPGAFTAPWTIRMNLNLQQGEYDEILEVACHEDNGDLQHLKDVRDEYRKAQKK